MLNGAGKAGIHIHRLLHQSAFAHYVERLGGLGETRGKQEAGDQGAKQMLECLHCSNYRRFSAGSEARPTPGFAQWAQDKTGYGSLQRFPLGLCLSLGRSLPDAGQVVAGLLAEGDQPLR